MNSPSRKLFSYAASALLLGTVNFLSLEALAEVANCPQCDAYNGAYYNSGSPREERAVPYTDGIPNFPLPIGQNLLTRLDSSLLSPNATAPSAPTGIMMPRGITGDSSYLFTEAPKLAFVNYPSLEALAQAQQTQYAANFPGSALTSLQRSLYPTTLLGLPSGWAWRSAAALNFIPSPQGWTSPQGWDSRFPAGAWPSIN